MRVFSAAPGLKRLRFQFNNNVRVHIFHAAFQITIYDSFNILLSPPSSYYG